MAKIFLIFECTNFLQACCFLCKNLSNFLHHSKKLHNPRDIIIYHYVLRRNRLIVHHQQCSHAQCRGEKLHSIEEYLHNYSSNKGCADLGFYLGWALETANQHGISRHGMLRKMSFNCFECQMSNCFQFYIY